MKQNETSEKSLLVFCNAPDQTIAKKIAEQVVAKRLAACANILPHCCSVYRWQGEIEQETEVPILLKTTTAKLTALTAAILALHPYDTPEVIAIEIQGGAPTYLRWIAEECQ